MRLAALTALFVLSCCVAPAAGADEEKLPAQLVGTGSTTPESGKPTTAPWSISINSQDADGNLKGTLNWSGRTCQISAVPFTGTYRNGVLDISAPATSRTCGAITMTLTKSSGADLVLEGTARFHGSETPAAVNLRPR
jgi:hypothetical protein